MPGFTLNKRPAPPNELSNDNSKRLKLGSRPPRTTEAAGPPDSEFINVRREMNHTDDTEAMSINVVTKHRHSSNAKPKSLRAYVQNSKKVNGTRGRITANRPHRITTPLLPGSQTARHGMPMNDFEYGRVIQIDDSSIKTTSALRLPPTTENDGAMTAIQAAISASPVPTTSTEPYLLGIVAPCRVIGRVVFKFDPSRSFYHLVEWEDSSSSWIHKSDTGLHSLVPQLVDDFDRQYSKNGGRRGALRKDMLQYAAVRPPYGFASYAMKAADNQVHYFGCNGFSSTKAEAETMPMLDDTIPCFGKPLRIAKPSAPRESKVSRNSVAGSWVYDINNEAANNTEEAQFKAIAMDCNLGRGKRNKNATKVAGAVATAAVTAHKQTGAASRSVAPTSQVPNTLRTKDERQPGPKTSQDQVVGAKTDHNITSLQGRPTGSRNAELKPGLDVSNVIDQGLSHAFIPASSADITFLNEPVLNTKSLLQKSAVHIILRCDRIRNHTVTEDYPNVVPHIETRVLAPPGLRFSKGHSDIEWKGTLSVTGANLYLIGWSERDRTGVRRDQRRFIDVNDLPLYVDPTQREAELTALHGNPKAENQASSTARNLLFSNLRPSKAARRDEEYRTQIESLDNFKAAENVLAYMGFTVKPSIKPSERNWKANKYEFPMTETQINWFMEKHRRREELRKELLILDAEFERADCRLKAGGRLPRAKRRDKETGLELLDYGKVTPIQEVATGTQSKSDASIHILTVLDVADQERMLEIFREEVLTMSGAFIIVTVHNLPGWVKADLKSLQERITEAGPQFQGNQCSGPRIAGQNYEHGEYGKLILQVSWKQKLAGSESLEAVDERQTLRLGELFCNKLCETRKSSARMPVPSVELNPEPETTEVLQAGAPVILLEELGKSRTEAELSGDEHRESHIEQTTDSNADQGPKMLQNSKTHLESQASYLQPERRPKLARNSLLANVGIIAASQFILGKRKASSAKNVSSKRVHIPAIAPQAIEPRLNGSNYSGHGFETTESAPDSSSVNTFVAKSFDMDGLTTMWPLSPTQNSSKVKIENAVVSPAEKIFMGQSQPET